jgi:hypothetical protein
LAALVLVAAVRAPLLLLPPVPRRPVMARGHECGVLRATDLCLYFSDLIMA